MRRTAVPATPTIQTDSLYLPIALGEECVHEDQHADVVLVLDASTSMLELVSGTTKMSLALDAARFFLGVMTLQSPSGDQAAVVSFNEHAYLHQALTSEISLLRSALTTIRNAPQTRVDQGLRVGWTTLNGPARRAGNRQVIIVLTDGRANPVPIAAAEEVAEGAKSEGITIFAIGLGEPSSLDHDALWRIASRRDYYYQTPDAHQLGAIYASIAAQIPCPPHS
jgi:Mg-chelatase subunit ChlD